ncbi:alkylation response protein AidB-like acyl-CoA dehydrogenase [Pseudonocardia sediminis]|uniref:Acyl-[acyl-carrier-protein] dehydrogenase MbtN n=1 Tax=Pseudonocardia sediminis TaxID=1397368 RepID=A0A4Q7V390_PSEST|nr:acyl-CoA dehydrogenase family protein [Pseudonocardia sediminis]RZT87133.1 alkylation response protein AidB-like acyl-CoA dehydrogenase [Pseudonocardia sediminis]
MIPRTIFSPEHDLFRDTVRRFVADHVVPHYAEWEHAGEVPRDVWRAAGRIGLLCPMVPESDGGPGGDFLHGAVVTEEMARVGAVAPTFYLQNDIVAPYLVHHGTTEQKQRFLPGMASGEIVAAVGMSEPSGGSDLANLRTTARLEGDEYVVNGQKVFITGGHTADLLVLAVRTGEAPGAKGVSLLLVETDRPGYHRGRTLDKIGCKAQDTSELFFDDLRVPASNLLGESGRGFGVLMGELAQERLVQAVRAVSSAEAALRWTVEYCADRDMYGGTLADMQNTRFVLAQLHADTMAQREFVDRAMSLHVAGELDALDAAAVKLTTTQLQGRVMDECLQLFGGWGYMTEYPIARAYVDARMTRVGGGSAEVMKHLIGRALFRGRTPERKAR